MKRKTRVPHVIRGNKGQRVYKDLVFVDTETTEQKDENDEMSQMLKLGVARYIRLDDNANVIQNDNYCYFNDSSEFYTWLLDLSKSTKNLYVYAHNMDFDFEILRAYKILPENGWDLDFFVLSQSAFMFTYMREKHAIHFQDTMQYFHTSVSKIGKTLNFPKLSMPKKSDSMEEWYTYCQRDVDVIAKMYIKYSQFVHNSNLGNQAYTIAGQAFNAYKHRFMQAPIKVHTFEDVEADEIASYHGGRCEPFFIGHVPESIIYDLDVNSIYPYVMKYAKYPTKYITTYPSMSIDELSGVLNSYSVVADCVLDTTENAFAFQLDKLLFPTGHFKTTLTTPEIEYAIANGFLTEATNVHIYSHANLFSDYVDYFYSLKVQAKKEKNEVMYFIAKLFNNSLYGKFGQRIPETIKIETPFQKEFGTIMSGNIDGRNSKVITFINWDAYTQGERHTSIDAFIAVAAHVTAYARMYLWQLMNLAGKNNVYYVDTDSLFVNQSGYQHLNEYLDEFKLGYLKIEKIFHDLVIYGPKDYESDNMTKIKGIPKNAKKIDENTYSYTHFERMRSRLRRGLSGGVPVYDVQKTLSRKYDKAEVLPSGWCKPFDF